LLKAEKIAAELVETVSRELHLDKRFVVLDYVFRHDQSKPHVTFLASSSFIENGIQSKLRKLRATQLPFSYSMEVLPTAVVGAKKFVLCNVSVAPVMKSGTHQSEQITQMLLGESGDLLQKENDWLRIRLHHDGYIGWASANQMLFVDKKELAVWHLKKKVSPRNLIAPLMNLPEKSGDPIREFLFGTFLPVKTATKAWTSVVLPDGRIGWLQSSVVTSQNAKRSVSSAELVVTAKLFLGISYQWGGRSVKGFDCSGFTQTVYRLNGIEIPRDASLQWLTGSDAGNENRNFAEGDLLFFSSKPERITHVAMSLGGAEFIHSSGFVKINSFDRSHSQFDNNLAQRFVGARRIIG
jgi:SH3-like domain-containing protein